VTWHMPRYTFASRLVNSGVGIATVKELLGHSSFSVSMRYAHTNMDSKRAALLPPVLATIWRPLQFFGAGRPGMSHALNFVRISGGSLVRQLSTGAGGT